MTTQEWLIEQAERATNPESANWIYLLVEIAHYFDPYYRIWSRERSGSKADYLRWVLNGWNR